MTKEIPNFVYTYDPIKQYIPYSNLTTKKINYSREYFLFKYFFEYYQYLNKM